MSKKFTAWIISLLCLPNSIPGNLVSRVKSIHGEFSAHKCDQDPDALLYSVSFSNPESNQSSLKRHVKKPTHSLSPEGAHNLHWPFSVTEQRSLIQKQACYFPGAILYVHARARVHTHTHPPTHTPVLLFFTCYLLYLSLTWVKTMQQFVLPL